MPTYFFATDLHGQTDRYDKLLSSIVTDRPAAVFLGGDLLPRSAFSALQSGQLDSRVSSPGFHKNPRCLRSEISQILVGRSVCIHGAHDGPELALGVLIWSRLRTLPGICSSSGLQILHGKFTRGIRDGIDLHGETRTFGDVLVGHPVHIEKTVCAIASPEEVDFREAAAPTFEP